MRVFRNCVKMLGVLAISKEMDTDNLIGQWRP